MVSAPALHPASIYGTENVFVTTPSHRIVSLSELAITRCRKNQSMSFCGLTSSPPTKHTSIIIAERNGGARGHYKDHSDATQPANTIAPVDTMAGAVTPPSITTPPLSSPDVAGGSTVSSANESSPHVDEATTTKGKTKQKTRLTSQFPTFSKSPIGTRDFASYATLDSAAGAALEQKCKEATHNCTLRFSEKNRPSAIKLATLLYVTSEHEPTYDLTNTQCCWFVETVFGALKCLFKDTEQDIPKHRGGTWNGMPVPTKGSVDERRAEQQQEEERQHEREEHQAAEERAQAAEEERQREREQRQAAEEERQREREQRQAAEERAQAAEEANAKLLQELEALRARASTS
ncbi:hypothetical protein F5141DRAFT_1293713 [Pisolithus sp. B1]|nr:hypothetical protein F5141DRAFT_1293713 [Pisolithus sp. B1]